MPESYHIPVNRFFEFLFLSYHLVFYVDFKSSKFFLLSILFLQNIDFTCPQTIMTTLFLPMSAWTIAFYRKGDFHIIICFHPHCTLFQKTNMIQNL